MRSLIIEGALDNLWQFEDQVAGKVETQAYLENKEDNLLLGEASSSFAQALLTNEQLKKINDARKLRRERLAVQKAREQEMQIVRANTQRPEHKQVEHQRVTAQIPTRTASPTKRQASASPKSAAAKNVRKQPQVQSQLADVTGHIGSEEGAKPPYFRPEVKPAYGPGLTIDKDHESREASLSHPNLGRIQGAWAMPFVELKKEITNATAKAFGPFAYNSLRDQGEGL